MEPLETIDRDWKLLETHGGMPFGTLETLGTLEPFGDHQKPSESKGDAMGTYRIHQNPWGDLGRPWKPVTLRHHWGW